MGRTHPVRAFATELALLGSLLGIYQLVRHLAGGHLTAAVRHAGAVWALERWLRLPDEAAVQHWALGFPGISHAANLYYVGVHFPGTALAMFFLWLRRRDEYLRLRTELAALTCAGLILHVLYPLAPPRLMPGFGMVDTMVTVGPSAYSNGTNGYANQYAAMPSLHVAWAILVAVAIVRSAGSRWRWLIVAHPVLTIAVVVVTANHYWLDGLVGTLLLVGAIAVTARGRTVRPVPGGPLLPSGPAAPRVTGPEGRRRILAPRTELQVRPAGDLNQVPVGPGGRGQVVPGRIRRSG